MLVVVIHYKWKGVFIQTTFFESCVTVMLPSLYRENTLCKTICNTLYICVGMQNVHIVYNW